MRSRLSVAMFCADTGYTTVRESAWSRPFDIPMPVHSLPTLFIGGERVVGAGTSAEELTALLAHARR